MPRLELRSWNRLERSTSSGRGRAVTDTRSPLSPEASEFDCQNQNVTTLRHGPAPKAFARVLEPPPHVTSIVILAIMLPTPEEDSCRLGTPPLTYAIRTRVPARPFVRSYSPADLRRQSPARPR